MGYKSRRAWKRKIIFEMMKMKWCLIAAIVVATRVAANTINYGIVVTPVGGTNEFCIWNNTYVLEEGT